MRQQIGFLLQLMVLTLLPMVIVWQLFFGFRLIIMPAAVLSATAVFWVGYLLRQPSK